MTKRNISNLVETKLQKNEKMKKAVELINSVHEEISEVEKKLGYIANREREIKEHKSIIAEIDKTFDGLKLSDDEFEAIKGMVESVKTNVILGK